MFGITVISLLILVLGSDLRIDFVLVTTLGGILIAPDAIDWARGRLGMFDPVGLIGVYGLYYFYISPLMTVLLDYNPYYVPHIDDKQQSLAMVGLLQWWVCWSTGRAWPAARSRWWSRRGPSTGATSPADCCRSASCR